MLQVQASSTEAHQGEVQDLKHRLQQADERAESLSGRVREADTLRSRMADLEAAAASTQQWQEAYHELNRQLQSAQVGPRAISSGAFCVKMRCNHVCAQCSDHADHQL